jgi:hypothetical protein
MLTVLRCELSSAFNPRTFHPHTIHPYNTPSILTIHFLSSQQTSAFPNNLSQTDIHFIQHLASAPHPLPVQNCMHVTTRLAEKAGWRSRQTTSGLHFLVRQTHQSITPGPREQLNIFNKGSLSRGVGNLGNAM